MKLLRYHKYIATAPSGLCSTSQIVGLLFNPNFSIVVYPEPFDKLRTGLVEGLRLNQNPSASGQKSSETVVFAVAQR